MIGGGLGDFAPGEWTDDTAMTWPIAAVAAKGADLTSPQALDEIAQGFLDWYASGPADIGNQTRAVLSATLRNPTLTEARRTSTAGGNATLVEERGARRRASKRGDSKPGDLATHMTDAAAALHARTGRTGGNGSLMRTSPVALVTALQAAWSAIHHTPVPEEAPRGHLRHSLDTAIRIGNDTDTVAAIAGGLLGARWGAPAVPAEWRRIVHGYPGGTAEDFVEAESLAVLSAVRSPR